MTDNLDAILRDYVEWSSHELCGDDETVDAFIGDDLLDAVDRAADLRASHAAPDDTGSKRWAVEPQPYCLHFSAHERHNWHYPHAVYPNGAHDHAEGDRDHRHDHEMPF